MNVEKVAKLNEAGLMRPAAGAFERLGCRTGVYSFEDTNGLPLSTSAPAR